MCLADQFVVKSSHHHGFVDPVCFERVELAVEQGAAVEIDQALGPAVDEMAEARALPCGENDCFHDVVKFLEAHCLSIAAPFRQ